MGVGEARFVSLRVCRWPLLLNYLSSLLVSKLLRRMRAKICFEAFAHNASDFLGVEMLPAHSLVIILQEIQMAQR